MHCFTHKYQRTGRNGRAGYIHYTHRIVKIKLVQLIAIHFHFCLFFFIFTLRTRIEASQSIIKVNFMNVDKLTFIDNLPIQASPLPHTLSLFLPLARLHRRSTHIHLISPTTSPLPLPSPPNYANPPNIPRYPPPPPQSQPQPSYANNNQTPQTLEVRTSPKLTFAYRRLLTFEF